MRGNTTGATRVAVNAPDADHEASRKESPKLCTYLRLPPAPSTPTHPGRRLSEYASWARNCFNSRVKFEAFVQEQRTSHANIDARLDRIEGDAGTLKWDFARTRAIQDVQGIASDMGLEFVRTLSTRDLSDMAGNGLPRDIHRSFRNADLLIEATNGADTRYIAMEIPLTADRRDCDRAIRNAGLITRFNREAGAGCGCQCKERPGTRRRRWSPERCTDPAGGPDTESQVNCEGAPATLANRKKNLMPAIERTQP